MREIKFRQFIDGKYHYWGFLKRGCFIGSARESDKGSWAESMQFTGLKDKNGKEMYEGDMVYFIEFEKKRLVVFYEGCFWFTTELDMSKESPRHPAFMNCGSYEIIGNIFENPELLK